MRCFPLFVTLILLVTPFSLAPAATLGTPADVSFTANDGTTQKYMQLLPTDFNAANQYDVIIALHGSGSDRTQYASNTREECRATRDVAANHDMIMISPDYRAYTSWMNAAAEADVVQIINRLKSQYNVGKVIVTGASMGGAGCLTFTALHPDLVDGVCSVNGLANFIGYTSDNSSLWPQIVTAFGGTPTQVPNQYQMRSAINSPGSFTMPMSITAGMHDATVPPQSVMQLFNTVQNTNPVNSKTLSLVRPTGGHVTNYVDTAVALEYVVQQAEGINTDLHPITLNTSFEYQKLSVGGSASTVDGWTDALPGVTGASVSVVNLTAAGIAAKFNGAIPDGSQIATVTNNALFQFTGTTVRPGTYHLTLKTASGKDNAQVGTATVGFLVDSTTVGTTSSLWWGDGDSSHKTVSGLVAGNWTTVNVDWTVTADNASIGKYLYIDYLATTGNSTMYLDGVHVSFTPVPEPSTFVLLAAGLVALAAFARKKRK
jgi:predicted esterase